MAQVCIHFHSGIAEKHRKFINILLQCAESRKESEDSYDIFCMWLVVASYHRAIHLLEALFISRGELTALSDNDACNADSRRNAEGRRERLLRKHLPQAIQHAFKSLQRLAFYVENFPNCGMEGFGDDYDAVADLDRTRINVVEGHLAKIEKR